MYRESQVTESDSKRSGSEEGLAPSSDDATPRTEEEVQITVQQGDQNSRTEVGLEMEDKAAAADGSTKESADALEESQRLVRKALHAPRKAAIDAEDELVVGVLTCAKYHGTRASVVLNTWAGLLRDVVFFSEAADDALHTVVVSAGPDEKWPRSGAWKDIPILQHLYTHFPNKQWYLLVDDDTFVFAHNLLRLVRHYNASKEWCIGHLFLDSYKQDTVFPHGGSGILLSNPILRALFPALHTCAASLVHVWAGDMRLGFCLKSVGRAPIGSRFFHGDPVPRVLREQRDVRGFDAAQRPVSFSHLSAADMAQLQRVAESSPDGAVTYRALQRVYSVDPPAASALSF